MVAQTISLDELPDTFEALRVDSSRCRVLVDPFADGEAGNPWKVRGSR
jgi:hypothetical protein